MRGRQPDRELDGAVVGGEDQGAGDWARPWLALPGGEVSFEFRARVAGDSERAQDRGLDGGAGLVLDAPDVPILGFDSVEVGCLAE